VKAAVMMPSWKSLSPHSSRMGSMRMAGMVRSKKLKRLARKRRARTR
jgi:hypothetical protein